MRCITGGIFSDIITPRGIVLPQQYSHSASQRFHSLYWELECDLSQISRVYILKYNSFRYILVLSNHFLLSVRSGLFHQVMRLKYCCILEHSEVKWVMVKFLETNVPCTLRWLIMGVLDCIVTISFGVYFVVWLF